MFCSKCGAKSVEGGLFCEKCGGKLNSDSEQQPVSQQPVSQSAPLQYQQAPVHQQPGHEQVAQFQYGAAYPQVQYNMGGNEKKRPHPALLIGCTLAAVVLVFFVLFIVGAISFGGAGVAVGETDGRIEGPGFDSAKEAVEAYLEALSNADLDAMIATFAIESFVENYDLAAMIERIRSYSAFTMQQALPTSDDFHIGFNIEKRRGDVAQNIKMQYMSLFMPEAVNGGLPLRMQSSEPREVNQLIRMMSNPSYFASLRNMELIEFVSPEWFSDRYMHETNQENIDRNRQLIGADEIEHVVARVRIDRQVYFFNFETVRYGERWYINFLGGNVAILLNACIFSGGVILEDDLFW